MQLKTDAINKHVNCDTPKRTKQEIVKLTLCEYDGENFPKCKCLKHECNECGGTKFREEYEALT